MMEIMTGFIIMFILIIIASYLKYRIYEKEDERKMEQEIQDKILGTKDLLIDIFKKWGCQYELNDEGTRIYVDYQGGTFFFDVANDSSMVDIYYPKWEECELSDIDTFSLLRKLVNEVNMTSSSETIVYIIDNDNDKVYLYSRKRIIFIQQIPEYEEYLRAMLNGFFLSRHYFYQELTRLKVGEKAKV